MRNTNLMLVHDSSAPPLTPDQLADHDGEPRIRDLVLADRLGFAKPAKIRELIDRNRTELQGYGEVRSTAERTGISAIVALNYCAPIIPTAGKIRPEEISSALNGNRGRGRPGKEYWLNEGQALVLCALSRTPQAAAIRKQVIEVFLAYRAGRLGTPQLAAPASVGVEQLAAMSATVEALKDEIAGIHAAVTHQAINRQALREVYSTMRTLRETLKGGASIGEIRRELSRIGRTQESDAIRADIRELRDQVVTRS